jgi:1-aminocyclopropane-1-carboxylate deaminase
MAIQKVAHLFSRLNHAPLHNIESKVTLSKNIKLDIKRDDLIHSVISGNKWRKLKHLLLEIEAQGFKKVAVMGGMYSNLLHSISYIGYLLNWQVTLYVRGHKGQKLSPMLIDAIKWRAKIVYVDRVKYREIRELPPKLGDDVFWIAEGGYGQLALKGSIESLMELPRTYDFLVIASATGTSLAGYCQGVEKLALSTKVIGIAVLNNNDEIIKHVHSLSNDSVEPEIIKDYSFGGYAKTNSELELFISRFEKQHKIPLEPVYSGKSFFAVMDMINIDYFPEGSRILLVHCGGLQGKR